MEALKVDRIDAALEKLASHQFACHLCPRECDADRQADGSGFCRTGIKAVLSHALLHFGEEPVLSGYHDWKSEADLPPAVQAGSGTIFFSGCNLKCLFCQNHQISWRKQGRAVTDDELAGLMLDLQKRGALNINLVSPSHLVIPILRALRLAYDQGLRLPLVWNSNGYEKPEVIGALDGIVDIYLPDMKYHSPLVSGRYSGAQDYFAWAAESIREMARQQPRLILDERDIALGGLIIRHLILPGQSDDSLQVLEWIDRNLPHAIGLSLMSQYHPCFRAPEDIRRPITRQELKKVLSRAEKMDMEVLFVQPEPFGGQEHLIPDFDRDEPFDWEKKSGRRP